MCGITGWVSFDRDLRSASETLDAMTETMSCRGPDDRGTWISGPAALGHRRLAIIDLPGGRQPMTLDTPQGTLALVYSGETYNFTELRRELTGRGHRFITDSDTEVVLHGYQEWGEALAERLNGMYAFAIWDGRTDTLVMIRDRMGIKPFYYYPTPDGVLFGSEPKAILANPLARARVRLDGLRELFAFVKTPGHAVWDGMREVEPGTVLTLNRDGLRRQVYWSLETRPHTDDRDTSVARVRTLLDDIVRRQLVADVPRCTLLSGGLDSSAMTALAARQLAETGERVRSFSVDFLGHTENFVADELRATPDTPFVHDVARASGTEHQDIVLDSHALADPDVRARMIRARDLPMGFGDLDSSLYLLFRAIRKHSTVALSGESADEVFGGYLQFFDEEARQAEMFPWLVRIADHFGDDSDVLRTDVSTAVNLPDFLRESYATAVADIERLSGESDFEYRMRKICYLHLTRFVRILLDRKDRASMAVGLEVRVPFCDHRLVEYVYNTPWSLKSFDGREKSLLREATADLLPKSVYDRVKSPYPSTQDPKYAIALQEHAKDLLANPSHRVFELVDADRVRHVTERDTPQITQASRRGLERTLDLAIWLDLYNPEITLT
ncbi:asparagine synthase (glutamine-hydrolyzing) [Streptomyces scopuliridis]|uniref:Asparagine synthase (Glutamine-hydrolyzing) n=1 Tax=Streptomyces scopuliridis TaxID=452529 RepID=A0ACD4ZNY3_9ACTN|nr:asparagine synthase (glutamine-hydrolyzing) [Streptomyces scopuliridis]WSB35796.1 asparagine synthase (glutamine-hydrolyzing) [Streptomyces scopuliridis]WSC00018.1 asparagine synthase (glutamine-hydrolyzing) [Streptomyces scopuliridis]WSC06284.1 asparagine synthase (glutamine-hydrolyzing) [Streptomyces scopuliridis]